MFQYKLQKIIAWKFRKVSNIYMKKYQKVTDFGANTPYTRSRVEVEGINLYSNALK